MIFAKVPGLLMHSCVLDLAPQNGWRRPLLGLSIPFWYGFPVPFGPVLGIPSSTPTIGDIHG